MYTTDNKKMTICSFAYKKNIYLSVFYSKELLSCNVHEVLTF